MTGISLNMSSRGSTAGSIADGTETSTLDPTVFRPFGSRPRGDRVTSIVRSVPFLTLPVRPHEIGCNQQQVDDETDPPEHHRRSLGAGRGRRYLDLRGRGFVQGGAL